MRRMELVPIVKCLSEEWFLFGVTICNENVCFLYLLELAVAVWSYGRGTLADIKKVHEKQYRRMVADSNCEVQWKGWGESTKKAFGKFWFKHMHTRSVTYVLHIRMFCSRFFLGCLYALVTLVGRILFFYKIISALHRATLEIGAKNLWGCDRESLASSTQTRECSIIPNSES